MTMTSPTAKVSADGDGATTVFSFDPLVIFKTSELVVTRVVIATGAETTLSEGSSSTTYSVSVAAFPGTGSITYPASGGTPLPATDKIVMKRVMTLEQATNLQNNRAYAPETLEQQLDRLVMIDIQQQEVIDRTLALPVGTSGVSLELPAPSAGLYLRWNSAADALENASQSLAGSLSNPVVVGEGGTGATTVQGALNALGLGTTAVSGITAIRITSTDATAAQGPLLRLYRSSASPADADEIGHIEFVGKDDGANDTEYAEIAAVIGDVTNATEDGSIIVRLMRAGALATRLTLDDALTWASTTAGVIADFTTTEAGASAASIRLHRNSASPADDDAVASLVLAGEDSASNITTYGEIIAVSRDVTNGTEDGELQFLVPIAGTLSIVAQIGINSDSDPALILTSTQTDALQGPALDLYRDSASPAASDFIGIVRFRGEDSASAAVTYANIHGHILVTTAGSHEGRINFSVADGGALENVVRMFPDGIAVVSNEADANINPLIQMRRESASPADSDYIGSIQWIGRNDAAEDIVYAALYGQMADVTDSTEQGALVVDLAAAGVAYTSLKLEKSTLRTTLNIVSNSTTAVAGSTIFFSAFNSASAQINYAALLVASTDATSGSEGSYLQIYTYVAGTNAVRCYVQQGVVVGSPTGADKGVGTINATAVYDDNVLLSCYVIDQAIDGVMDEAKWDGKVPDRFDADGNLVEQRRHDPMRKFRTRIGTEYDPLTLAGYARHWKEKRHLPSLPNEATFNPTLGLPTGAWIQRLLEDAEIKAVLMDQLAQEVEKLKIGRPA